MPYQEKNNNNRGRAVARRPAAKAHSSLSSAPTRIIPLVEVAKVSTVEVGVVWFDGSDVHVALVEEVSLDYMMLGLAM